MSNQLEPKIGGTGADLSASGGTGKFLKQLAVGAPFSVANILTSELPITPLSLTALLSGSGTYTRKLAFTITSGSATVGATYTNNGATFTVFETIANATLVYMTGASNPSSSGTLTKASGTGDTTLTFSQFNAPTKLLVTAFGGGGGGAGSGSGGGTGGTGGNTTFGTSLIVANGGVGGANNGSVGGAGGTASLTNILGIALSGGSGTAGYTTVTAYAQGGRGGGDGGGSGAGGSNATTGGAGVTNTGGGGGGAGGSGTTNLGGAGGGAGGQVLNAIIINPATTYSYAVGPAGTAGSAGASGFVGGIGGSGAIWVTEIY